VRNKSRERAEGQRKMKEKTTPQLKDGLGFFYHGKNEVGEGEEIEVEQGEQVGE